MPAPGKSQHADAEVAAIPREVQEQILRAVAGVRYGSVEIVIHGARVVQIESREKTRIGEDLKSSR